MSTEVASARCRAAQSRGRGKSIAEMREARVAYAARPLPSLTASGERRLIQGPLRYDARRAQADLEAMRAAAIDQTSRAEHYKAMADKAHALQKHAAFEVQVAMLKGKKI